MLLTAPFYRLAALTAFIGGLGAGSVSAITIGPGPSIGIDKRGTVWYQEFQDWTYNDLRALDTNADVTNWDGNNTSRDLVAFYSRDEGTNYFFRVDLFDLGFQIENGGLDLYVLIDCVNGGRTSFPDSVRCNVDPSHPWDIAVKVYDTVYRFVEDSSGATLTTNFPTYWRSDLDAVEFSIPRSLLTGKGWNGSSPVYFQVAAGKDFSNQVADAIGNFTPATPTANGSLTGAIASTNTAGRAKYAIIAHANQSVAPQSGTQGHIYTDRSDLIPSLHPGFIRLLDSAEMFNTPVNLHISGTLMMSFLWAKQNPAETGYPDRDGPTFMQRCKDFVTTGPGSLIGGVLAEHIMPYFEGDVNRKSIEQNSQLIEHYFGLTEDDMKVMHVPERVIRSQTNHAHVSASGPLTGKTFEDIEQSGFTATYLDEVTHLHWWFYPNETNNPGWDDNNCGRWAGGQGNDEEPYHHKVHKINGVYTFMINDREDQSKFGNDDGGMALDTRYTLLQKARSADSSQITIVFDDWEALAGNSFASPIPNNNADQFHTTLRWAANKPWIEIKNLKDVLDWAVNDPSWVIDQGYRYDLSSQTYEWLKRASEQTYDNWYYGSVLEENFFARTAAVHNGWSPGGMKKYGDMNTPGTLIRDSWDTIQQITSPYLKMISEWSYSAMIYETAWHDEDANPDQYKSRNYQVDFNRSMAQGNCDNSVADTTYDPISGWAVRLHGHVRDMGVMKAASDWVENVKSGAQGPQTTVYAADIDDDQLHEYILCNDKVFLCIERWGARVIKAFVYDPFMNGGDARMVVGVPVSNPPEESENEGASNNRTSVFKDHWSTGQESNGYIDMDFANVNPVAGADSWEFVSADHRIRKRIQLPAGRDVATAHYSVSNSVGTLYVRNGLGPNQLDIMFNGTDNLVRKSDASFRGLMNNQGGETYMVLGKNSGFSTTNMNVSIFQAGWDNRELPMIEQFELSNIGNATNFSMAIAFSEASARDADGDGLSNTNEWLVGTDALNPDTDGDGIPDGWEVAMNLNPLNAADAALDDDNDSLLNWQEYIAGTLPGNSNSYFAIAEGRSIGHWQEIQHIAQSGRMYQIYFADQLIPGGWNWQSFANTNIPFGRYYHATAANTHTFTDEYTSATSGQMPTNGIRLYSIKVSLP